MLIKTAVTEQGNLKSVVAVSAKACIITTEESEQTMSDKNDGWGSINF
jgi:hypothetical protein